MYLGVLFVTEPTVFILSLTLRRIFPVVFIYPREIHDFAQEIYAIPRGFMSLASEFISCSLYSSCARDIHEKVFA